MKKIIGGRLYDTKRTKNVGFWSNNRSRNDPAWEEITLRRKRNGEFFLHKQGGPGSSCASLTDDGTWGFGERIIPLSYRKAVDWAKKHLNTETFDKLFGPVVESDKKEIVAYYISGSAINMLRRMSEEQVRSASEVLDDLIKQAGTASTAL